MSISGEDGPEGLLQAREGLCLYVLARRSARRGNVVEIGSWKGRSTWFLARGLEDQASPFRVVAIDPHLEGTQADFEQNVERHGIGARVDAHVALSHDVVKDFSEPVGMLWIDGDHSYAGVRRDFESWFPKLAVDGYVAFHDTVNLWHGPTKLVRELLVSRDDLAEIGVFGSITYARKTSSSPVNRLRGLWGRAGFEAVAGLRGRRLGRGPMNSVPGER